MDTRDSFLHNLRELRELKELYTPDDDGDGSASIESLLAWACFELSEMRSLLDEASNLRKG